MATPYIIKYPLDVLGTSVTNKVVGEELSVPRGPRSRAFALKAGPFFANSVVVRDAATGQPLTPMEDYKILYELEDATIEVGQSIRAVVWVHNESVYGNLLVDYQVLGGKYQSNGAVIAMLIETLQIDERVVEWDDILFKPVYYPPAPHLHHVRDWYGFDDVIAALDRITAALGAGTGTDLSAIFIRLDQIDTEMDLYGPAITQLNNTAATLIQNVSSLFTKLRTANLLNDSGPLVTDQTNHFLVSATGTLPDTTGLPVGTEVPLSRRATDISPIVSVFDENTETLRYRTNLGTAFNYNTKKPLKAILVAARTWEISL